MRRTLGERITLAAYILGHVLFNAVLRYPGPILNALDLCSYLALADEASSKITPLFKEAAYTGPFSNLGQHFWRDRTDNLIEKWAEMAEAAYTGHLPSYRRAVVEEKLGGAALARHRCLRCHGERGGYRCPYTRVTVCERSDCSVGSSGWIPQRADLSRVERTFYDETAPMLGS